MQFFTFNQRVENLYKSYFLTYENVSILSEKDRIKIDLIDEQNLDSASLELIKFEQYHQITFWDGYSHSEIIEAFNEKCENEIKFKKILNS